MMWNAVFWHFVSVGCPKKTLIRVYLSCVILQYVYTKAHERNSIFKPKQHTTHDPRSTENISLHRNILNEHTYMLSANKLRFMGTEISLIRKYSRERARPDKQCLALQFMFSCFQAWSSYPYNLHHFFDLAASTNFTAFEHLLDKIGLEEIAAIMERLLKSEYGHVSFSYPRHLSGT